MRMEDRSNVNRAMRRLEFAADTETKRIERRLHQCPD